MQQTLGSYLQKHRKEKNISLEQASFNTKIRLQYLKALEDDDLNVLPSKVQGKGFLRLYAEYLGLQEKLILSAWQDPNLLIPNFEALVTPLPDLKKKEVDERPEPLMETLTEIEEVVTEQADDQPKFIHFEQPKPEENQNISEDVQNNLNGSKLIFSLIGDTLKQTRLSLHLSIEEIEKYTNIRSHYLFALENGNLDELPSPVQGRGMLSNYAKFLNLDYESLLTRFAEGLQVRREEQLSPELKKTKNKSENQPVSQAILVSKKYLSLDFIMTIILILGVFGIILFAAAQIASPGKGSEGSENPPSISDVLLQETPGIPENTVTPTSLPITSINNGGDTIIIGTNNENGETNLPVGNAPIQVYVIAKQRVFLKITADDEVVFSGRTIPGNAYEFSAEEKIDLLTGNASGIDVYFNQESVGTLGDIGEVKNLLFTLEQGMITPTPRFSPTPTSTVQPTATSTSTPTTTPTVAVPTPTVTPLIP